MPFMVLIRFVTDGTVVSINRILFPETSFCKNFTLFKTFLLSFHNSWWGELYLTAPLKTLPSGTYKVLTFKESNKLLSKSKISTSCRHSSEDLPSSQVVSNNCNTVAKNLCCTFHSHFINFFRINMLLTNRHVVLR